jgi:hypothetical protein
MVSNYHSSIKTFCYFYWPYLLLCALVACLLQRIWIFTFHLFFLFIYKIWIVLISSLHLRSWSSCNCWIKYLIIGNNTKILSWMRNGSWLQSCRLQLLAMLKAFWNSRIGRHNLILIKQLICALQRFISLRIYLNVNLLLLCTFYWWVHQSSKQLIFFVSQYLRLVAPYVFYLTMSKIY